MTKPVQLTNDFWLKEIILNGNPKLDEFYKEDLIKMVNICREQNLKYKEIFNKVKNFVTNADFYTWNDVGGYDELLDILKEVE